MTWEYNVCPRKGPGAMALPRIHLNDIPKEGLNLSLDVTAEDLALASEDGQLRNALSLSMELVRMDKNVTVAGMLSGTVVRECARCLVKYGDRLRLPIVARFRPGGGGPCKGLGLSSPAVTNQQNVDEEVYSYVGGELEIEAVLREQVILAAPMQPLCDEGCLGLCPACGQNRNDRACGCLETSEGVG